MKKIFQNILLLCLISCTRTISNNNSQNSLENTDSLDQLQTCPQTIFTYQIQIKKYQDQLELIKQERNQLKKQLEKIENEVDNEQQEDPEKKKVQLQQLKMVNSGLVDQIQVINTENTVLRTLGSQNNSLQQELFGISNELQSLRKENQQLQSRIQNLQGGTSTNAIVIDLRNQLNQKETEIQNLRSLNESNQSQIDNNSNQSQQEIVLLNQRMLALQNQNQNLIQQIQENQTLKQENDNLKQRIQNQQQQVTNLNSTIEQLQIQNVQIRNQNQTSGQQSQSNDQIIILERKVNDINIDLTRFKSQIESLNNQNSSQKQELSLLRRDKQNLIEQVQNLRILNNRRQIKKNETISKLQQELESLRLQNAKQSQTIQNLNEQLVLEKQNQSQVSTESLDQNQQIQIQVQNRQLTALNQQLKDEQNRNTLLSQKINSLENTIDNLNLQIVELNSTQVTVDNSNEIQRLELLYRQCSNERTILQSQLSNLNQIEQQLVQVRSELETSKTQRNEQIVKQQNLEIQIKDLNTELQQERNKNDNLTILINRQSEQSQCEDLSDLEIQLSNCNSKNASLVQQNSIIQTLNVSLTQLQNNLQAQRNTNEEIRIKEQNCQEQLKLVRSNFEIVNRTNSELAQNIEELRAFEQTANTQKIEIDSLKNQLQTQGQELQTIIILQTQMDEQNKSNEDLLAQNQQLRTNITDLQTRFTNRLEKCEAKEMNQSGNLIQIAALQAQVNELNEIISELNQQIENTEDQNLQNILNKRNQQIVELRDQINELQIQRDNLQTQIKNIQNSNDQIRVTLIEVENASKECQLQRTNLLEQQKNTDTNQNQQNMIQELEIQRSALQQQFDLQITMNQTKTKQIEELNGTITVLNEQINNKSSQIEQLEVSNQGLASKLQELQIQVDQCDNELELINTQKLIQEQNLVDEVIKVQDLTIKEDECQAIKEQRNQFADQLALLQTRAGKVQERLLASQPNEQDLQNSQVNLILLENDQNISRQDLIEKLQNQQTRINEINQQDLLLLQDFRNFLEGFTIIEIN